MRLRSLNLMCTAVVFAVGCGPGLPSLEGFGTFGDTDGPPGDGDGDPGDGDGGPGDGDGGPGDGDGDPGDCIDADYGQQVEVYAEGFVEPESSSDHSGECAPSPGPDYSMAWTAPQTSTYRATVYSEFPGWLSILRGGCDGWLETCAGLDFPSSVEFEAIAGQDYTFVVDSEYEDFFGYFEFSLFPVQPPGECPHGQLSGTQDSVSGSTAGAGNGFESPCGGESAPDHSYLFVPPVSGIYSIDMFGSGYDTMLHVFEGECGGSLVDCNDDAFDLQSEVIVELFEGQVYTIIADGFGNSSGNYQLNVSLLDGPQSLCDDATILPSDVPVATDWPVQFDFGDLFGGCSLLPYERRFIWYAPADGLYRATQDPTPGASSLAVLPGGCDGDAVICEYNEPGQEPTVVFPATAGQEIVLISEWAPEADDLMALTIELEGGGEPGCGEPIGEGVPVVGAGSSLGAGNDFEGSCSVSPAPEDERWWTAPANGTYRISLEGSNYDTLMYVRDGGCDGEELACNDDTFTDMNVFLWSSVELELAAGQTISIFIDGYNGSGSYDIEITEI